MVPWGDAGSSPISLASYLYVDNFSLAAGVTGFRLEAIHTTLFP